VGVKKNKGKRRCKERERYLIDRLNKFLGSRRNVPDCASGNSTQRTRLGRNEEERRTILGEGNQNEKKVGPTGERPGYGW